MIDVVLDFLKAELNSYLRARTGSGSTGDKVNLSSIVDESGKYAIAEDSIGISIIKEPLHKVIKAGTRCPWGIIK